MIYIIVFIFLLIACSSRNRQCRECLFDTISVNHVDEDSLLYSFLDSDAISFDISLSIEASDLKSKQVKVVVENLQNDTLVCV